RGGDARRGAGGRDQAPGARAVLAPPRARRGVRDPRGPADALRQGPRGPGEADPDGHPARAGGEPRLARKPGRARLLRRARRAAQLTGATRIGGELGCERPPRGSTVTMTASASASPVTPAAAAPAGDGSNTPAGRTRPPLLTHAS